MAPTEARCIHDMILGTCGVCDAQRHRPAPTCRWCGRELRDPVSQELGTGPQCFANETRMPDYIRDRIAQADSGVVTYGPLPRNSANNWLTAFGRLDGVKAQLRTDENDEAQIYLLRADDWRSVRRQRRT